MSQTDAESRRGPEAEASDAADPVALVARIAESLPSLDAGGLELLAQALDELTEAVGLALDVSADAPERS